mmetsp:Transcript_7206/g.11489  ORF Transcript_7206/g.11489 Transcript_7206/m.11489 type:complete len:251 (+) Transcript_7206:373-1125(+)
MGSQNDEQDDDLIFFEPSLFLPKAEDYVLESFEFGGIKQQLYVSPANSTDYDLTGTIVWPVAKFLCHYIVSSKEIIKDSHVLELGAGCALCGLVASQLLPTSCTLTDGEELVLKNIDRNISLSRETMQRGCLTSRLLRWGAETETLEIFKKSGACLPNLILGADVFHPSFGDPREVFNLVSELFAGNPGSSFIVGFVDRGNKTNVFEAAKECGYGWQNPTPESFLPENLTASEMSYRKLEIYDFSKKYEL